MDADVIVVGAGLAGLVATAELADAGRRVILLDQEPEQNLGGQAFWSFGGLFFVDSPEQRRMRIRDSFDLAWQDWLGTAGFDRAEDAWPTRWAEAYVRFAAGEKRAWLHAQGVRFFPVVGWAERGGYGAIGHGNSVPRFHVTWGTGPGLLAPFIRRVRAAADRGLVTLRFRHRVTGLSQQGGVITGVDGELLEASDVVRARREIRPELRRDLGAILSQDLDRQLGHRRYGRQAASHLWLCGSGRHSHCRAYCHCGDDAQGARRTQEPPSDRLLEPGSRALLLSATRVPLFI